MCAAEGCGSEHSFCVRDGVDQVDGREGLLDLDIDMVFVLLQGIMK